MCPLRSESTRRSFGFTQRHPALTTAGTFAWLAFSISTVLAAQVVSPGSINIDPSAACGGGSDTVGDVCVTLPDASTCDTVDIFLLFDDTGSFAESVPATGQVFGTLVTDLTTRFPKVDFAFGVGRFEDYGGPGVTFGGLSKDRPFILNQALLTPGPGFQTALDAALLPDPNGTGNDGGDLPESAIEALFQVATGVGFDANGDGDTTDASEGDVPTFSSYGGLASGNLGGAGWRAESCHRLAILATDFCTVAPFAAGTAIPGSIVGADATVPSTAFSCAGNSRFGSVGDVTVAPTSAATVPRTVQALNNLGIRVIGLGTGAAPTSNSGPSNDESVFLSALARLTGAVDANGEPLVFDLGSDSDDIKDAIVEAIETSLSTPIDVVLVPDPELPGLTVTPDPPVQENVAPGQEACFSVTFDGDESFAGGNLGLNFVDQASNGSLGMTVPVNLKCPKCFDLVTRSLLCDADENGFTGSFEWTFIIRNRSPQDVAHLFFVDLPANVNIEPQHLTFSPPIRTNQPRLVTVRISGADALPGSVLDFRITLHDQTLAQCCAGEVQIELPKCDCAQLRVDNNPSCFSFPLTNTGPPWRYTFDLENLTTVPVDYLLLSPVSPADHETPVPPTELVLDTNVLLLGSTLFGGDETGSITTLISGPAAIPRDEVCFRLSTHDATFAQCCSIVKCLTIPDCTFGAVDFEELGGATVTRSGTAVIVSDIGPSGEDGVGAAFGPASGAGISLQDFSAGVPLAEGAYVRFAVSGVADGALQEVADVTATLAQEQVRVAPQGSPSVAEVQILLDGEIVASILQPAIVAAVNADWPTGFVMVENLEGFSEQGALKELITTANIAGVAWSGPVPLQLGDQWEGVGDEARFFFEDVITVEGLSGAALTAAVIPTLVLKRFDFEPAEDVLEP